MKNKIIVCLFALILGIAIINQLPNSNALDVSVKAMKARESNRYSPETAWELGYTGKGVNIAVSGMV